MHEEEVKVPDIMNQKLDETTWQHMPSLLIGAIANVGHQCCSLELAANPGINTLWPSPVCLHIIQPTVGQIPYINEHEVPQANVTVDDDQKTPNLRIYDREKR